MKHLANEKNETSCWNFQIVRPLDRGRVVDADASAADGEKERRRGAGRRVGRG